MIFIQTREHFETWLCKASLWFWQPNTGGTLEQLHARGQGKVCSLHLCKERTLQLSLVEGFTGNEWDKREVGVNQARMADHNLGGGCVNVKTNSLQCSHKKVKDLLQPNWASHNNHTVSKQKEA